MKLQIDVTPLYGAQTDDHAIATVLSLDGLNILLDCGWNSSFDPTFLTGLAKVAPTIHAVLLSHPDIPHLGALPYASAKLGLTARVFATLPVWRMGQMFMYDAYISQESQRPFDLFDLDDVDATFDYSPDESRDPRFKLLKYQQGHTLTGFPNGEKVTITPHRAGHMIGGTIWHITKDTASIVYAVHINHRKDRHLSPTTLSNFSRPSHLLLSATNALAQASAGGEERLMRNIRRTIKLGGNVLIPADTAGRIIELAVLLDNACEHDPSFRDVRPQLIVLHSLATRTFDFARSMIEWSSDEFMTAFDVSRNNLFQFKNVRLVQDLLTMDSIQSPAVILASSPSLESGPARSLFCKWAGDSRNTVILVDRKEEGTLSAKLFGIAEKQNAKSSAKRLKRDESGKCSDENRPKMKNEEDEILEFELVMGKKVPLEGEELNQWREKERTRKRLEAEQKAKEEEEARKKEELELLSNDPGSATQGETDGNDQAVAMTDGTLPTSSTAGGNVLVGSNNINNDQLLEERGNAEDIAAKEFDELLLGHLRELGVVQTKKSELFECEDRENVEWDEYGQKIDTVRFIIGEDPGEGGMFEEKQLQKEENPEATKDEGEQEVIPTKHVTETIKVTVRCGIVVADCSGISDGDSLRHLVKEVEPRHVTIVAGTKDETKMLGQNLKKALAATGGEIATPKINETVAMVSDVSVYNVSLDDTLVKTVHWENIGLAKVGFVDGRMTAHVDSKGLGILGMNDSDRRDIEDFADEMDLDQTEPDQPAGQGTFFVGTIMLNKLKDRIMEAGLRADFAGGALCVENPKNGAVVLVKKVGGQHISLQGSLCEEYFTVQDLLYSQVVIPR